MRTALLSALLIAYAGTAAAETGRQFLLLSDIHFNPLANPALTPQLMAAEPSQWEAILAGDSHAPPQKYGEDTNWSLLRALVAGVQKIQPKPRLILITGDLMPHHFQERFADPAAFRAFARKTFAFISLELAKASGGAPVVYTLGNNDEDCGDYALQPGGPFLQDTEPFVQNLAHVDTALLNKWSDLGSYAAINPLATHHRIIALNTNFWSYRYQNSCGDKAATGGDKVIEWLSAQLEDAQKHGDKVWLVYHIPPGVDGYSSARAGKVVSFWKPAYEEAFRQVLDQYRRTIELNLAAHTHLDDIRLVKTEHTTALVFINPAVSPNIGQSPAFRLYTVDSKARLADIATFFMPSLDSMQWLPEYSVRSAYGMKKIDAKSYQALEERIPETWQLYYSVSRPASLNPDKAYMRALYCATWNESVDAFQSCLH